jgi:hypothetical protein
LAQDAGVDCSTLPNPLYVPGTTLAGPLFNRIAPKLEQLDAGAMTIIYQGKGSCAALSQITPGSAMTGTAVYWGLGTDGGYTQLSCSLPTAGVTPDMGMGDVSIFTCTGADAPGFDNFSSYVEPFGFIVPMNSTQTAITAEEAHFIMKFGDQAGDQVPPWTDPNFIVIRNSQSSTQLTIGMHIGVSGTMWSSLLTNMNSGGGGVLTKVAAENTTGNAEKTLGILACDTYDPARNQVKMLAFQAFNQSCLGAVYPDSSSTSFDKKNVRDGHYPIWGHMQIYSAVDGTGQPTDARVKTLVNFLSGNSKLGNADPIVDVVKIGNLPLCAMDVKRAYDGAPIEPETSAPSCACYYESIVGTTSCATCTTTCSGGKVCRNGYCEAR